MLLKVLRREPRSSVRSTSRATRLRQLLQKAGQSPAADVSDSDVARVAATDWHGRSCEGAAAEALRLPLRSAERIALFCGGFLEDQRARRFEPGDWGLLANYQPDALVLPLQLALEAADRSTRGLGSVPELTSALIVMTSLGDGPLQENHRDLLWRAFRVPVFEQLRGWDGAVIARECEVHDGLHIDTDAVLPHVEDGELIITQFTCLEPPILRVRTGLSTDLTGEHCECGAETPRLKDLCARQQRKARFAVA